MLYALLNGYDEFSMWPLSENEQEALDYLWIFRATNRHSLFPYSSRRGFNLPVISWQVMKQTSHAYNLLALATIVPLFSLS